MQQNCNTAGASSVRDGETVTPRRRLGALAGLGALVAAGALAVAVEVASAAPSADLSASISPPVAANPGSAVTLSFTARNNGPERAQSVTVTVDLTRGVFDVRFADRAGQDGRA